MALGTNLSALWILVANGWMQNPVGARINYTTMRMELTDFWAVLFNPDAQAKFVHTVSAGYVTGSVFVLAICAWYLLKGRDVEFAKRSFRIAAAFGLASAASVIVLGDESGYTVGEAQQTKMAALEAMWTPEPAPAGLKLVAGINEAQQKNDWEIEVPWVLGLIGTRSVDRQIPSISEIKHRNRIRIKSGIEAVGALAALRADPADAGARTVFEQHKADLGFGLLVRRFADRVEEATSAQIEQAVDASIPRVLPMFWTFRAMVGLGFLMLALFVVAFWSTLKIHRAPAPWLLKWALWMLPAPWIASELGWFVAEYGRQPWTIYGVLPTCLSASNLSSASLVGSLTGFVAFYTLLLVVELYLMLKYARLGPGTLGTGRYAGEPAGAARSHA
jgi:cytochrome d ubiquinol oxidase subunit I